MAIQSIKPEDLYTGFDERKLKVWPKRQQCNQQQVRNTTLKHDEVYCWALWWCYWLHPPEAMAMDGLAPLLPHGTCWHGMEFP